MTNAKVNYKNSASSIECKFSGRDDMNEHLFECTIL